MRGSLWWTTEKRKWISAFRVVLIYKRFVVTSQSFLSGYISILCDCFSLHPADFIPPARSMQLRLSANLA